MENNLELRLYGLVPYNLSPIQQGIQFLHGTIEYSLLAQKLGGQVLMDYINWTKIHKTVIIYNGGTTNINSERMGTLNTHYQTLIDNKITCQVFHEPDLGDQLTAVVFMVDERVYNKTKYPDFQFEIKPIDSLNPQFVCDDEKEDYEKWVESIGGLKNLFLRSFLKQFRFA